MNQSELAAALIRHRMSETAMAVAYVWWKLRHAQQQDTSLAEVRSFFIDEGISRPNMTRLRERLAADRRVMRGSSTNTYRIRAAATPILDEQFEFQKPSSASAGGGPSAPGMAALEKHAQLLGGEETRRFVLEAVECAKASCRRAAIIMAWSGAVSVLQEYAFLHHLTAFNDDAVRNGVIKKPATTLADFRDVSKESAFLESLARISIIDGSQKKALKRCLDLRNDCSHPSQLRIGDAAVADHIESLLLNVFDRFGPLLAKAA